ncbi:MAG: hypothetical protein KIT57_09635 [Blastocatellales bacterium]|nr:hypothetical protein [Blastocatellales bacterium]
MKLLKALVPNSHSALSTQHSALSSSSLLLPILLTALSLSIGWGIRGNFGHEIGALTPGALAAAAVVLTSGRPDWHRRIAYFAFFGALGWSFGGSMSYGQVLGYTHSGHSPSVLYGFASLFVIGFLWGAMGTAGTAMPAVLDRRALTEFFAPISAVFIAWWGQDRFVEWLVAVNPAYRQESPLYWYDTDWLGVLAAIVAVLVLAVVRRRFDEASRFILYLAVGWWAGFVLLVLVFGLRMTPPRGDNWAGCTGMTAAMILYFVRRGQGELVRAAIVGGFFGGFGFAFANALKLIGVATGWATNWHSVMEQTYGFINGLGVAVVMLGLARRSARLEDDSSVRRWTDVYAVVFVLAGITYLNLRRNPVTWVNAESVPAAIVGVSAEAWFALAYLLIAVMLIALLIRHRRHPLSFLPADWHGRGQLFYLVFLWWMVVGNFERSVVAFAPTRMITEGVIFLHAVICTMLLLTYRSSPATAAADDSTRPLGRTVMAGAAVMVLCIVGCWGMTRVIYGDAVAGNIKRQIRFGSESTATRERPAAGQPHP